MKLKIQNNKPMPMKTRSQTKLIYTCSETIYCDYHAYCNQGPFHYLNALHYYPEGCKSRVCLPVEKIKKSF